MFPHVLNPLAADFTILRCILLVRVHCAYATMSTVRSTVDARLSTVIAFDDIFAHPVLFLALVRRLMVLQISSTIEDFATNFALVTFLRLDYHLVKNVVDGS